MRTSYRRSVSQMARPRTDAVAGLLQVKLELGVEEFFPSTRILREFDDARPRSPERCPLVPDTQFPNEFKDLSVAVRPAVTQASRRVLIDHRSDRV